MSLVHNERVKLRAAALDRLSTAFVALGCIAPWVTLGPDVSDLRLLGLVLSSTAWMLSAWMTHLAALRHLRNLRE